MLRSVHVWLVTDVLGEFNCLTLEDFMWTESKMVEQQLKNRQKKKKAFFHTIEMLLFTDNSNTGPLDAKQQI
jgi:hypothetical protein